MGKLLDNVRLKLFGSPVLGNTNINLAMAGAGTSFATLIEGVGTAVAKTQAELDATSGVIATEMANTEIDTVQAVVTNYSDSGNILSVNVVTGTTSALAIAVPPALSFQRVHLEGNFVATAFSAAEHSNVNIDLMGANLSLNKRKLSVGASIGNSNIDSQVDVTQDSSVASMSMTAAIRPKPVTALSPPPLVFSGPTLALTVLIPLTISTLVPAPLSPTDPPAVDQRSMVILVKLTNSSTPSLANGKVIAIDCGGLSMEVTDSNGAPITGGPAAQVTGAVTSPSSMDGVFFLKVSRQAAPTDPAKEFILRGSLNLINAALTISL